MGLEGRGSEVHNKTGRIRKDEHLEERDHAGKCNKVRMNPEQLDRGTWWGEGRGVCKLSSVTESAGSQAPLQRLGQSGSTPASKTTPSCKRPRLSKTPGVLVPNFLSVSFSLILESTVVSFHTSPCSMYSIYSLQGFLTHPCMFSTEVCTFS